MEIIAIGLLCTGLLVNPTYDPNGDIALEHTNRLATLGVNPTNLIYISFTTIPVEKRKTLLDTLHFVLPSTSKQRIIERTKLTKLNDTLYFIDMMNLKWSGDDWREMLKKHNPYGGYVNIVRPNWLIDELVDTGNSDAHYQLLYGSTKQPKTLTEFLSVWDVSTRKDLKFGLIEGESGVSVQGQRWIENLDKRRGDAWGTKDVLKIGGNNDFLQSLDGNFKNDGQEWIIGDMKLSLTTGKRGTLHYYFLVDAKENRISIANGDLVVDHTRFKGKSQIRNVGSCMSCHIKGFNETTQNLLKSVILQGVNVYAKGPKLTEQVEAFHLGELKTEIAEGNKRYAEGIMMCNGLTPEVNNKNFVTVINDYAAKLDLEDVARELHVTPDFYKQVLLVQKKKGRSTNSRLIAVAGGIKIPRETFEDLYNEARLMVLENQGYINEK